MEVIRIILDTNIYGFIVKRQEIDLIRKTFEQKRSVKIYGFEIIRKELREVPRKIRVEGKNLRIILLSLYDELTKISYQNNSKIESLARDYFSTFRELGGVKKRLLNDFRIVSCAALNNLDIVVSEDSESMRSELSMKTYRIVNQLRKLRTPEFYTYDQFRRLLF